MPWNQTDVMTEKERFVMLARTGSLNEPVPIF